MDKPKKSQDIFLTIGDNKKKQERKELIVPDWKKGSTESAAAAEPKKEEEEFQWIFPEETERKEDVLEQYVSLKRPAAKWTAGKLFIIVVSAVLIGLLLGYAMVKVVTQKEEVPPQAILKEAKVEKEAPAPAAPATPKAAGTPLLPVEMAVVQGGVFSTKEAAAVMEKQLASKGLPAEVVTQNDQHIILLAASSTVETAKLIGSTYETAGAAVYAKQTSIAPAENLQETAGELAALFPVIAEESGKKSAGVPADLNKLQEAEQKLQAVNIPSKDETSAKLKQLLTEALTEAKSDQPQAAKAAQEKLLAFLAVYGQ
ncbi:hypothetical protein F9802_00185 [Bacillus aerolatus]|uniref:SPOR domain-containing protein n=1 Tax=Bacillus aerolatus TaxID=2653354 RepID=A0A6I1FPK6_9BACI|nr:hypothetical protein [Bacillus aerolatus]KAB7708614.1 hypothetical protein F9802_00185 [Bacillus aerolatus]